MKNKGMSQHGHKAERHKGMSPGPGGDGGPGSLQKCAANGSHKKGRRK